MLPLYASAIFVSAFLLFVSEPMFARMVLPLLGGSPSVWNTAMVFYQAALLAGYAYAHALRRAGLRWRLAHLGLMAAAAGFFLPLRLISSQGPPAEASPIGWLLATMAITIGPPFLLVSTTGPLLQRWFGQTAHPRAPDPYFLYSVSNAGSLLGLLAYPFVVEPALTLAQQSFLWSVGYGALMLLVLLCALLSHRAGRAAPAAAPRPEAGAMAVTWSQRLRWIALAFVPSSLMLGVTTHLSMDIIAIPLFWVLPLAIYLLTFILAFARRPLLPFGFLLRLFFFTVLGVLILLESHAEGPIGMLIALHLSVLFTAGMVCHSLLAAGRPPVVRLTEFYLWVATGGVLGGVFNALLAPMWFHSVAEYPVALVIACLLVPPFASRGAKAGAPAANPAPSGLRDFAMGLGFVALLSGVVFGAKALGLVWTRVVFLPLLALLCLPLYALRYRPVRFGLVLGGLMVLSPLALGRPGAELYVERSFFGIHRVALQQTPAGAIHQLRHGTTVHGLQWADPRRAEEPLGYYHRLGPVGQIFATLGEPPRAITVGVAGLGTGGLTAYARSGQRWTFYEIDPSVLRIASNPAWFSYLARSAAPPRISLGDARLNLAADTSHYDLLILDAYTSDAMPLHLLTREAFQIYREHLSPHGVLVAHISNRYFDLIPTLGALAADADLVCRIRNDRERSREDLDAGLFPACFGVMARREEDLGALANDPRWQPPARKAARVWTDDYASVIGALR